MSTVRTLKTDQEAFQLVWDELKLFEWRKNDRNYQIGDTLVLREHEKGGVTYLGRRIVCRVTSLIEGVYGIPEGYCIMGIAIKAKIDDNVSVPSIPVRQIGRLTSKRQRRGTCA